MIEILDRKSRQVLLTLDFESLNGVLIDGVNFQNADLRKLDFSDTRFKACNFADADCREAVFSNAKFQSCSFKRTAFVGAKIDSAEMSDSQMDVADMRDVRGAGVQLRHCKINNADLTGAYLKGADCSFSEMRCNLHKANLSQANLYGVDFTGADLSYANLTKSDMSGAVILNANFTFAKMTDSIGTNGKPWGNSASKHEPKKPWWQIWKRAAL